MFIYTLEDIIAVGIVTLLLILFLLATVIDWIDSLASKIKKLIKK